MISIATPTDSRRLATFRLEDEWCGIDVLKVQEVLMQQDVTEVPLCPAYVRGLINVRGLIVSSISLKQRLGFHTNQYQDDHYNIIVPSLDGTVCLTVDEVGDVIVVSNDDRTEQPPTVPSSCTKYITGVYRLPQQLIVELDVDALCSAE